MSEIIKQIELSDGKNPYVIPGANDPEAMLRYVNFWHPLRSEGGFVDKIVSGIESGHHDEAGGMLAMLMQAELLQAENECAQALGMDFLEEAEVSEREKLALVTVYMRGLQHGRQEGVRVLADASREAKA